MMRPTMLGACDIFDRRLGKKPGCYVKAYACEELLYWLIICY